MRSRYTLALGSLAAMVVGGCADQTGGTLFAPTGRASMSAAAVDEVAASLKSISIVRSFTRLHGTGTTVQLGSRLSFIDHVVSDSSAVRWASLTPNIATITDKGLVAVVSPGQAFIIASFLTKVDTLSFPVMRDDGSQVKPIVMPAPGTVGSTIVTKGGTSGPASAPVVAPPVLTAPVVQQAPAASSGPAALPSIYLDTREIAPTGKTITVSAGGNLQAAIDAAQPGDEIALQAGATFVGNYLLPKKNGSGWITIRSSSSSTLPAGRRVTTADAPRMPKILTPNSDAALATVPGAHNYRLVGLELSVTPAATINYGVLKLGNSETSVAQLPTAIIVDRSFVHGLVGQGLKNCIVLNSAASAVIDSRVAECHETGQESHAIVSWNTPGPLKVTNNFIEGAGINFLVGGADPTIPNLVVRDIEFRNNYVSKQTSWKGRWDVKNLFELKNAQRVLVEGNVFENNWADAQAGFALLIKSSTPDNAPWVQTTDVTIRYNLIRNSAGGVNIAGALDAAKLPTRRVTVEQNIFENIGSFNGTTNAVMFQLLGSIYDITIRHNTAPLMAGSARLFLGVDGDKSDNLTFTDNVVTNGDYGLKGSGMASGTPSLNAFWSHYTFSGNVILSGATGGITYPAGNLAAAVTAAANGAGADLAAVARYTTGVK